MPYPPKEFPKIIFHNSLFPKKTFFATKKKNPFSKNNTPFSKYALPSRALCAH